MKYTAAIFVLLLQSVFAYSQNHSIIVRPVVHGSISLQIGGTEILVDPYSGVERYTSLPSPDLILITDIHGDHYDPETLWELPANNAVIIAPEAVAAMVPDTLKSRVTVIRHDETLTLEDVAITAIPMYNLPETTDSRHPKGRGNGYIITFEDKRIYISGDTEDIPEMRQLENIYMAFICMNLPYTMSVDQAASAVLDFKPDIVYPFHYRGPDGLADVNRFKSLVSQSNPNIEVRLENWYPDK